MGVSRVDSGNLDHALTDRSNMNSRTPLISVVMSCFNAADFVATAIESILNQTFSDFEFIIIDDGSSDNTLDITNQYALQDSRIIVIQKENTGLTDSLNLGIQSARGLWIARMDADDVSLPTRLEEQVNFIEKYPNVLLVGTDFIEMDQNETFIKVGSLPNNHYKLLSNLETMTRFFPHSSAMYSSDVVRRLGKYNPRIVCAEDYDLWLRIAELGEIACINIPLVKIRKHSRQVSLDSGGRTQVLHGVAALVCHFLRCRSERDPSSRNNDVDWPFFVNWLEDRIKQEKFFELRQDWLAMRQTYFSHDNRLIGIWCLAKVLAQSRHSFQLLHDKFFGTSLPLMLADEWVKIHACT